MFQLPAVVSVVNHLLGHATIDAYILARDEAGLVATKEQHHIGYVHGIPNPASRLLSGIGAFINGVGRIYPTGRDGVHPCPARQAYGQCVSECGNATLGRRVTLRLRLAHAVARGGYVNDGCTISQMVPEQFYQVEGCGHSHTQGILELLVGTFINPPSSTAKHC